MRNTLLATMSSLLLVLLAACTPFGTDEAPPTTSDQPEGDPPPYVLTVNITGPPSAFDGLRVQFDDLTVTPAALEHEFAPTALLYQLRVPALSQQDAIDANHTVRIVDDASGDEVLSAALVPSECIDQIDTDAEIIDYYFGRTPPELTMHSRSCVANGLSATLFVRRR